jgi:antitoxin component of RelBE/YafQ-DinJ toxin-antitoxin module
MFLNMSSCVSLLARLNLPLKRDAPEADEAADEAHDSDIEGEPGEIVSPASSKKRKTNNKGLVILGNGVVAMRDLALASRVPTKTKDEDTPKLYNASLTLSKAFTLLTLVVHGKNLPIEKVKDEPHRVILLRSAAPYCLSKETLDTILGADRDEKNAYLIALAKNAQQVIRYVIYGLSGNYMNERVFTPRDVFPADDVKLHLGLTGDNARKCFMEL